jgi:hypothetical protein
MHSGSSAYVRRAAEERHRRTSVSWHCQTGMAYEGAPARFLTPSPPPQDNDSFSVGKASPLHIINIGRNLRPPTSASFRNLCSYRPNYVVPRPASASQKQPFTKLGRRLQSAHGGNSAVAERTRVDAGKRRSNSPTTPGRPTGYVHGKLGNSETPTTIPLSQFNAGVFASAPNISGWRSAFPPAEMASSGWPRHRPELVSTKTTAGGEEMRQPLPDECRFS